MSDGGEAKAPELTTEEPRPGKIAEEVYERWRLTPNRDAYVAAMMRVAATAAYRAGRKDAARDIEAAAELLVPKFAPPDEVTRRALMTAQRAAEIARGQAGDAGTVTT